MPVQKKSVEKKELEPVALQDSELKEMGLDFKQKFARETVSEPEARKALEAARKASYKGNWAEAARNLLIAWDRSPNDLAILTVLAHSLVQLGVREKAIAVLERALQYHKPTPEICSIMMDMAIQMSFFDIAIKVGHLLVQMAPNEPQYYVNLAAAYAGDERYDEAIELLQGILPRFPQCSDLWNVLATTVRSRWAPRNAVVFFQEALRVDPNNFKALSNYSNVLAGMGEYDEGLKLAERAIKLAPHVAEPKLIAANILFAQGDMERAWSYYEVRRGSRRGKDQGVIYTHGVPDWKGQPLAGKTLFVTAEQGIGDEVMFGNYLPFLYDAAEQLVIGCDPRLVSIYRRRFPKAIVGGYHDRTAQGYRYRLFLEIEKEIEEGRLHVDYAVPVAGCARFAWTAPDKIEPHPDGFLTPDPALAKAFGERIAALGEKPKVGLAWRSGYQVGDRKGNYAALKALAPLFALKDQVEFINLQYGDCADELAQIKEEFGVEVHAFEDVDLKKDIEANLAIMTGCDIVISAVAAPAMFAMSAGVPVTLLVTIQPWWRFGHEGYAPFVKDATFPALEHPKPWAETIPMTAEMVRKKLGLQ